MIWRVFLRLLKCKVANFNNKHHYETIYLALLTFSGPVIFGDFENIKILS